LSSFVFDRPAVGPGRYLGHEQLVRSLLTGLEQGRSFLLCGGPKTGRTSTLLQLAHLMELLQRRNPKGNRLIPVPVNLISLFAKGQSALAAPLYEAICERVLDPKVFGNSVPPRAPTLASARAQEPFAALQAALTELFDRLSGTPGWCRYVLLLDDADLLFSSDRHLLQQSLAKFVDAKSTASPRAVVLAGGRLVRETLFDTHSPWAFARPLFLSALKRSDAETIIRAPFEKVAPSFIEEIQGQSGCHPYLLQRLLAEHELQQFAGTEASLARGLCADLEALGEALWREFDLGRGVTYRGAYAAPEHALMQALAEAEAPLTLKQAERELGIKPLKEFFELLDYLGLVERLLIGNDTCYRASSQILNRWYLQRIRR